MRVIAIESDDIYISFLGEDIRINKKYKTIIEKTNKFFTKHDILTELPNSICFFDKLNKTLEISKLKNNKKGAVIYIDIDNYKSINDNWGYSLGDSVLKSFSKLIKNCTRKNSIFFRLNGDEFAIIIEEIETKNEVEKMCKEIYDLLRIPFKIRNDDIYLSVSMGISVFLDDSINADELLKYCDFAMYKSKHLGKGTYTFFNNEALDDYCKKALIESEFKNAIRNKEFELFYQPQINTFNNKIIGIEALLRWNNSKLGSVSPKDFIPIAEKNGDIIEIGSWVIEEALKQAIMWKERGYKFNNISVNISPIQMRDVNFKENLLKVCSKYSIPPNFLEIEITEGALMDNCEEKVDILNELIKNGINVAIDDFGTGYSSLSYLMNIPIDTLKIDKVFIDNIENHKNKVLIKGIINLSKELKYRIVTEGVETKSQLEILTELGCNIIQGFYFSKPVSSKGMEKIFKIYN